MKLNRELIQQTFEALSEESYFDQFTDHFFQQLFDINPEVEKLCLEKDESSTPLRAVDQYRKTFQNAMKHVVEYLGDVSHLQGYLKKHGAGLASHISKEESFYQATDLFIQNLRDLFGSDWNDEFNTHWQLMGDWIVDLLTIGWKMEKRRQKKIRAEKEGPSLEDAVRSLVRDLFQKALENEVGEAFERLAREKARAILKKALEQEARSVLGDIRKNAA